MRIISKHNDYYDSVQAYGFDDTITYVRKSERIETPEIIRENMSGRMNRYDGLDSGFNLRSFSDKSDYAGYRDEYSGNTFLIGFCGKTYIGIKLSINTKKKDLSNFNNKMIYDLHATYNNEDLEKIYRKYYTKLNETAMFKPEKKEKRYNKWNRKPGKPAYGIDNFLSAPTERLERNLQEIYHTFKIPVFAIEEEGLEDMKAGSFHKSLILNPKLADYSFYKMVNSFQAHQEIQQFIGGVLGTGMNQMVEISNADMLIKKGFNNKSFKAVKGDKKPRRTNRAKK